MSKPTLTNNPAVAAFRPTSPFSERRLVWVLALAALLLASASCALGYFIQPPGTRFIGTAYNIDDYCNYLSWLRQTLDGRFFLHDQFTTEPQHDLEFNVFFWGLGRLGRLVHAGPQAVLLVARVGGGAALLALVWRLYRRCLPDEPRARLTAFGFACLSGGWGWLVWGRWHDRNLFGAPVDAWQPEAFTFLTLDTSALMTCSTALIVAALYALLRGEQTGQWKYPVWAGVCGAVLGNMHSYDVLHIAAAWGLFLVVWTALKRGRGVASSWARGLIALALTLPTTAYQYLVFQREAVFHARANTLTLSPAFWHYILGYGIVFALACIAIVGLAAGVFLQARLGAALAGNPHADEVAPGLRQTRPENLADFRPLLVAACWSVAGLMVIYLPVAFQRKMIMGTHIPLCLLAGVGAVYLTQRLAPRAQAAALCLLVALSVPTSLLFILRDCTHLTENKSETQQVPFLSQTLVDAYDWLRANTPPGSATVGFPALCASLPGYAGRPVWAGHWGETPQYGRKVAQFAAFADTRTSDADRRAFLAATGAQYLLYPNDVSALHFQDTHGAAHTFADLAHAPVSGTAPVYVGKDWTIFRLAAPSP